MSDTLVFRTLGCYHYVERDIKHQIIIMLVLKYFILNFFYQIGDIGELEGLRIELEDSRDMLEQEKRSKTQLERKLQELEQILDDQRIDSENIQQTLTAKVCSSKIGSCRRQNSADNCTVLHCLEPFIVTLPWS